MTDNQTPFAAYGDRANPNVRELQQALSRMGQYTGGITGAFDDATYQAYRQACAMLQRPVSRDAQGRLVVTLADYEALEQQAGSHTGSQPAYPPRQLPPEDDYAKRSVPPEDDFAKRPVMVSDFTRRTEVSRPRPTHVWHGWKLLVIAAAVMVVVGGASLAEGNL